MKTATKLGIGVGILAALSPIGLILPEIFKAGSAWGEWGPDEVKDLVGYIPADLEKLSSLWKAILPDYAFSGWESKGLGSLSFAYAASALAGIALCVGFGWLLGKTLTKKNADGAHDKA
jgi:cobalt/nickel transport protein